MKNKELVFGDINLTAEEEEYFEPEIIDVYEDA